MTRLIRKIISGGDEMPHVVSAEDMRENSFEKALQKKISAYIGKSKSQLKSLFEIENNPKNINELFLGKMLGIDSKISNSEEFQKANIVPKSIRIEENGHIKESMSFPNFKFVNIIRTNWENSQIREYFETTKFMFTIFSHVNEDDYVFKGIFFWNMPIDILDDDVKTVWKKTKKLIKNGHIVKSIDSAERRKTYFPSKNENPVAHVRPHGRNRNDTYPLPSPDKMTGLTEYTKQCFWLNNDFILGLVKKNLPKL